MKKTNYFCTCCFFLKTQVMVYLGYFPCCEAASIIPAVQDENGDSVWAWSVCSAPRGSHQNRGRAYSRCVQFFIIVQRFDNIYHNRIIKFLSDPIYAFKGFLSKDFCPLFLFANEQAKSVSRTFSFSRRYLISKYKFACSCSQRQFIVRFTYSNVHLVSVTQLMYQKKHFLFQLYKISKLKLKTNVQQSPLQ